MTNAARVSPKKVSESRGRLRAGGTVPLIKLNAHKSGCLLFRLELHPGRSLNKVQRDIGT